MLATPIAADMEEQRRRAQQEAAERQRWEQQKDVFVQKEKSTPKILACLKSRLALSLKRSR
jgi:hypothetical protein